MEYHIIEMPSLETLQSAVNNWLMYGWKPQGGVTTTVQKSGFTYYLQALVRIKQ